MSLEQQFEEAQERFKTKVNHTLKGSELNEALAYERQATVYADAAKPSPYRKGAKS